MEPMTVVTWIVFGLLAGYLAKIILPGKDPGGIVLTCLLGVAGAFVGGFVGSKLGFGPVTGFNLPSLGVAIVGALLVLFVARMVRKQ